MSYPLTSHEEEQQMLLDDAYRIAFKDIPQTSSNGIAGLDTKTVERMVNGFSEMTKVVIEALDELQKIHPFISGAILAFKLVVTLDLTRRENNKKVIAIQLQMQDTLCVLFQLRHMKDQDAQGPDGITIQDRMQELMTTIARDIKECGSACDVYMKKNFLAKTLKSKIYEQRLAEFGERFIEHRNSLQLAIAVHMSLGVESANAKLDKQDDQLRLIEEKLRELLRKLDTPRERDVLKFIDDSGGPRACVENDKLLEVLLRKSGESFDNLSISVGRHGDELTNTRRVLQKELSEDLDEAFQRNMTLFEGKLDIQLSLISALRAQMADQEHNIISAIRAGSYERIRDPDLREIWKEMGWKGSVKARHFVLALRDHFADRYNLKASPISESGSCNDSTSNDEWTLSYVNVAHLQPILEAIDDDGTGFINIKEVNTFCRSCPPDWTLLQWLAYWAAGWQLNITKYKDKIYSTIQDIFCLTKLVLNDNRQIVNDYLDHWMFCRLDLLLRYTKSTSESVAISHELAELSQRFASMEETLLEGRLKPISFEVDSPTTVTLVTGPGRIERYIYPLLRIILRRHLDVIKYACHHILHKDELEHAITSLSSLFTVFDNRTSDLEAIYRQMHLNVKSYFENFAFGMFLAAYGDLEALYRPSDNEFLSWDPKDEDEEENDEGDDEGSDEFSDADERPNIDHISAEILKYGIQDDFLLDQLVIEPSLPLNEEGASFQGSWSGYCYISGDADDDSDDEFQESEGGLLSFNITQNLESGDSRNLIHGTGEHYLGILKVEGSFSDNKENPSIPAIELAVEYANGSILRLEGFIDWDEQSITGKWRKESIEEDEDDDDDEDNESNDNDLDDISNEDENGESYDEDNGTFMFTRTPSDVARFKYTSKKFNANRARARWAFALNAVQYCIRQEMGSWDFIRSRLIEGRDLLKMTVSNDNWEMDYTTAKGLTEEKQNYLEKLRQQMDPADARLYHALAEYVLQRQPNHGNLACDSCEKDLIFDRYTCITCIKEDFSTSIDLCGDCIDEEPTWDTFSHSTSHTLLRSEHILLDTLAAVWIPVAQDMSQRIKSAFRNPSSTRKKPLCACCEKAISIPCWVCVECPRDLYVCQHCHQEKRPITQTGKYADHHPRDLFIRIYDAIEVEKRDKNQLNRLERRLDKVEKSVEKAITTLDSKFSGRLSALEDMLKQLLDLNTGRADSQPQSDKDNHRPLSSSVPHGSTARSKKGKSQPHGGGGHNNAGNLHGHASVKFAGATLTNAKSAGRPPRGNESSRGQASKRNKYNYDDEDEDEDEDGEDGEETYSDDASDCKEAGDNSERDSQNGSEYGSESEDD